MEPCARDECAVHVERSAHALAHVRQWSCAEFSYVDATEFWWDTDETQSNHAAEQVEAVRGIPVIHAAVLAQGYGPRDEGAELG